MGEVVEVGEVMFNQKLHFQSIEAAVRVLKPSQSSQTVDPFYRQQAWNLLQSFLSSLLSPSEPDCDLYQLLKQVPPTDILKYWTWKPLISIHVCCVLRVLNGCKINV